MASPDIVRLVEREIDRQLSQSGEVPTLPGIASRLHLHVRALQRQLGQRHVAFRQLLDDRRRHRAMREVAAWQHDLANVAARLGYSDQAHFTRAFRRWTGLSPTAYRKAIGKPDRDTG